MPVDDKNKLLASPIVVLAVCKSSLVTSKPPIVPLVDLIAPVLSTLKLRPTLSDAPASLISSEVSLTK